MQLLSLLGELASQVSADTADTIAKGTATTAADVVGGLSSFSGAVSPDDSTFLKLTEQTKDGAGQLLSTPSFVRNGPRFAVIMQKMENYF